MKYLQRDSTMSHALDPRTGYSVPELARATVAAPTTVLSGGLATAAMVLDPQAGVAMIERLPDCEAYLVSQGLQTFKTANFNTA